MENSPDKKTNLDQGKKSQKCSSHTGTTGLKKHQNHYPEDKPEVFTQAPSPRITPSETAGVVTMDNSGVTTRTSNKREPTTDQPTMRPSPSTGVTAWAKPRCWASLSLPSNKRAQHSNSQPQHSSSSAC